MNLLIDKYSKEELETKFNALSKEFEFMEYQLRSLANNIKVLQEQYQQIQKDMSHITYFQDIIVDQIETLTEKEQKVEEKGQ